MINLELAKKLKDAGLEWRPEVGDWFYNHHGFGSKTTLDCVGNSEVNHWKALTEDYCNRTLAFAPSLSQLLAEIEKRGWGIDLQFFNNGTGWFCEVAKTVQFRHNKPRPKLTINHKDGKKSEVEPLSTCPGWGDFGEKRMDKEFTANSPDESAAQALLWVLEQEVTQCK